jgi:ABC-2 type transport system ATP-binding protein
VEGMEYAIEVSGLTKLFNNNRGIENMSFNVNKGEIYGFFGPNGSGKTTLMKILTGLCKADQGKAAIFGYDVVQQFEQAMAKVGTLIETADAYTYMSGYQNLVLAARFYPGLPRKRIDEVLELVGLAAFAKEKVANYSLGMKQRLGLASALLSSPELVILDEPTNGLDIEGMVDVRETIIRLAKEQGITFFISSHLIREMELMCSRIGIVHQGRFINEASISEVLQGSYDSLETYYLDQISQERKSVQYA